MVAPLAIAASLLLLLASAQAFASSPMTSSLSVSSVVAGNKVDLTTQIPAVSATDLSTQEIIQNIDPLKVKLTGASDVKAPAGWNVTYSTDGTTFLATPSNWAQVVKVKATGTVNSGGVTGDGKQLFSTTATSPGTLSTVSGAIRSGGDGFSTSFDSRGFAYNTYHRGLVSSSIDCRNIIDGTFCSAAWPFNMATHGFGSNIASTQFFDEVNKHIWIGNADSAQGTGFVCVDVSDVKVPELCGGSKATAFKLIQARTGATSTSVFNIIAAEGKIYAWDIAVPRILCLDYLANDGMGQSCTSPTLTGLSGTTPTGIANAWPNIMTNLNLAFGNVYGQYGSYAVCFNASTQALCPGWTGYNQLLGSTASNVAMYLQPNAAGQIAGVCFTNDNKCFAADGTRFNGNSTVQAAITSIATGRFQNSTETVGSKFLIANQFNTNSSVYCYDYATNAGCANWPASTSVTGMGQMRMLSGVDWKVYTIESDPRNSDCLWTNGDSGVLGQVTISTATFGCQIDLPTATFKQAELGQSLACDGVSGAGYEKFTLGGLVRGTDYTSATLTIKKANGSVLVSGGQTWSGVAFNAQDFVDLSSISMADIGTGATFNVSFVGKNNNKSSTGTLLMESTSAQLCLSLTVNVICPATTLVGPVDTAYVSFEATGKTTSSTDQVTNYTVTSSDLTVAPPAPSACGFLLTAQVGRGQPSQAFPANAPVVVGATAILADSSGTTLNDAQGNPITAVSDESGVLSFGYVKPGTYKVKFTDFPLVNGTGAGDIVSTYIAPYGFVTGQIERDTAVNFATIKTPLATPSFTGTAGTPTMVKALYIMRASGTNDVVAIKTGSATLIDVVANDTPTTTASFALSWLKICAAGTTSGCNLDTLTVANKGTFAVETGLIKFTPVAGFSGVVDDITYSIKDNYTGTPTITAKLTATVVPAPTPAPDTLSGNTLAPITVDVTSNDSAAAGATLNKASVKLCVSGTTTNCAQTSVLITGKGTYSVNNLGVVTFTPVDGFVGPVTALTYSIQDTAGNTVTSTVTATVTNTPPRLTTPAFETAKQGIQATYTQSTTQGTGIIPATGGWAVVGSVPPGMTFSVDTGAISGVPTTPGTYEFTVTVTDANGLSSSKVESIKVAAPPVITTSPLTYKFYKDVANNIPATATAGTGTIAATGAWSATGLPAGLSINTATGAISGTATTTGTYIVTQKVIDSNDLFDTEDITIKVVAKPVITTPALPGFELNKAITPVEQTKTVGSALLPATNAWSIVAGTLPNGLSLNPNTGEITGTPTQSGTFPITVKLIDEDGEFSQQVQTINVGVPPLITTTPLTHKLYVGVAANLPSTATAGTGALQANGWTATGLPTGMSINPATGAISGTPSATGTFEVIQKVTDVNNLFDVETINVTVVAKPVITTTVPLPKLVVNAVATPIAQTRTAGSATIPATGAWSIASGSLPAGLTLNPDTGAISGTPTVAGSFPITVKLTDADGEFATKEETVEVIAPPVITTSPTARTLNISVLGNIANTVTVGSANISPFNGWTATGLPQGLNINGITGVISGTPTALGSYPVTVRATDLNGLFDEEVLTITIVNGPVITTTPTSYTFGVGNDLSFIADDFFAGNSVLSKSREIVNTATKGSANIGTTAAWSAVGLPAGLTINPDTGKISGAATTVGTYPVDVKVTDTAGFFSTKTLTINIVQGPKNTTPRVYSYELDIKKRIGIKVYDVKQTWTLGSAELARGVPFFIQGSKPSPVSGVSIVSGEITILPYLFQAPGKEKYGPYTLKTLILDRNGAYDLATFTINLVKPGSNLTTLPLPVGITDGMQMTASTYPLAGTSSAKLPVTYTSSTPKVCTVDSAKKTMKMVNEGTCTITASSGTGAKLSKAAQSFTITKLPQTVSIVAPGQLIPGGLLTAPMPTDDPNGFKLYANATSGLTPTYESLDPNICSIDVNGLVTWDADLTITPRVESDFSCRVKVTQPGNTTYSAAPPQTITLVATHVEPPAPEGGVAKEPAQSASLPAAGGTTPLLGGTGFKVIVDSKKKTVTVQPMSKGRWIGPIYADITIKHLPKGSTTPYVQTCKRNYFGIAIYDSKKAMVTPPLGGDNMVVPELPTHKAAVTALIKQYQAMTGKFATTKIVKGKKVVSPGYLDWKPLFGQTTCVLDAKTYAAWKSGIQIEAKATVTRDRRWPTTYAKYKSYDWKNKSNNGLIFPTVVEWNLKIG